MKDLTTTKLLEKLGLDEFHCSASDIYGKQQLLEHLRARSHPNEDGHTLLFG